MGNDPPQVEEAFQAWISQYPASGHALDADRYYAFVRAVCEQGEPKGAEWLREKTRESGTVSDPTTIDRLAEGFGQLQEFYRYLRQVS